MKGYLVGGGVLMGIERWIKVCWDKECSRVSTWSEVIWGRGGVGGNVVEGVQVWGIRRVEVRFLGVGAQ